MKLHVDFNTLEGVRSFPLIQNGERDERLFSLIGRLVYEFSIVEHTLKQCIQIMLRRNGNAETFEAAFLDAEDKFKFESIAEWYCSLLSGWECPANIKSASTEYVAALVEAYKHRNDIVHGVISHKEADRYYLLRSKKEKRDGKTELKQWITSFSVEDVERLVKFVNFSRIAFYVPFKEDDGPAPGFYASVAVE